MFNTVESKLIQSTGIDENRRKDKNDCSVNAQILAPSLQRAKIRLDANTLHLAVIDLNFHTYLGQRNEKIQFI